MKYFFRVCLPLTGLAHWVVINVDRFVAMAVLYAVLFALDDLLVDSPNDVALGQYGITASIRGSPVQIKEYYIFLTQIYAQKETPTQNSLEVIMSEVGRDMLRSSNPEWFSNVMVASLDQFFQASIDSHAGIVSGTQFH